ncbi:hypothetical protein E2320_021677, partial [Naja naja]
MNLFRII